MRPGRIGRIISNMDNNTFSRTHADLPSLFTVSFDDGSVFALPHSWRDVFEDYFGAYPSQYAFVAERLRFVVSKYRVHRAWPTKFDGLLFEEHDDRCYDEPDFYFEHWDDWDAEGRSWGEGSISAPPTDAQLAEAVLYQAMRAGILQKALDTYAQETGTTAPRVMTPEQFMQEFEQNQNDD